MGILNNTPDSFYDGGKHNTLTKAIQRSETLLKQGAKFIDIGGYSSRPGAKNVSVAEEIKRTAPLIKAVITEFPDAFISIDTFRSEVAKVALNEGAALVNDISAGTFDTNMLATVAKFKVPFIGMHLKGALNTMHQPWEYANLISEMLFYFSERLAAAKALGLHDFIIDPGFGFSKNTIQNFELLDQLELLKITDRPILVGLSRKSMIYKTLNTTAKRALNGTTCLNTVALLKGASILRVHDVKEAMECIKLTGNLNGF